MINGRQDGWSKEEDEILAKVVLRHISECSTQLQAFIEVGELLSRTAAACGFRWNSTVRKNYNNEIISAKNKKNLSRNDKKKVNLKNHRISNINNLELKKNYADLEQCIEFLKQLQFELNESQHYQLKNTDIKNLISENRQFKKYINLLQNEIKEYHVRLQNLSNNYNDLINFFEKNKKPYYENFKNEIQNEN